MSRPRYPDPYRTAGRSRAEAWRRMERGGPTQTCFRYSELYAARDVQAHLRRLDYRGWTFSGACVPGAPEVVEVIAFHAGPDGELTQSPAWPGCWAIPWTAGRDEIDAVLLPALVALHGPGAIGDYRWKD